MIKLMLKRQCFENFSNPDCSSMEIAAVIRESFQKETHSTDFSTNYSLPGIKYNELSHITTVTYNYP